MKALVLVLAGFLSVSAFASDESCELNAQGNKYTVSGINELSNVVYLSKASSLDGQSAQSEAVKLNKMGVYQGYDDETVVFSGPFAQNRAFVGINFRAGSVEVTEYSGSHIVGTAKKSLSDCR